MPDPDIPVYELQNSNGTTIGWIRADTTTEDLEIAADGDDIVLKDAADLDGNSIKTVNDITGQSGSVTVIDGGGGSGSELRLQNGTSSNSVKIQESDDLIIDAEDATLTNAKGNDVQVIGGNGDGTGAQGDVIINANALAPDTDGTGNVGTDSTTWSNGEFQNLGGGGSSVSVDDDLDLQSSQSLTNASSISTDGLTVGGTASDQHRKLIKSVGPNSGNASVLDETFDINNGENRHVLEFRLGIRGDTPVDLEWNYENSSGNELTSQDYDYRSVSGTSLSTTTGDTKYTLGNFTNTFRSVIGTVVFGSRPGGGGFATITADLGVTDIANDTTLEMGKLQSNLNTSAINLTSTEAIEYDVRWYEVFDT